MDYLHRMSVGKTGKRYLLDRSALPELREARVMHHPTVADVHAMMAVSATRSCQVGAERRFLLKSRRPAQVGTHIAVGLDRAELPGRQPIAGIDFRCSKLEDLQYPRPGCKQQPDRGPHDIGKAH